MECNIGTFSKNGQFDGVKRSDESLVSVDEYIYKHTHTDIPYQN